MTKTTFAKDATTKTTRTGKTCLAGTVKAAIGLRCLVKSNMGDTRLTDRFWLNVDIGTIAECWPWTKGRHARGYGWCTYNSKSWCAHRLAYLLYYHSYGNQAAIAGLVIRHTCDNPICCNPYHLLSGTQYDNMNDKVLRNRQSRLRGEDHGSHILTEQQVLAIREAYSEGNVFQKDLAAKYGVSQVTISNILVRRTWTHLV